jgi:hypothetical protein
MKKSYYLQIFMFAIIVALMGSFNNYGQDGKSTPRNKDLNGNQIIQLGDSKGVSNFSPLLAVPLPVIEDMETINTVFPPTGWSYLDTPGLFGYLPGVSGYGIGTYSIAWDFYDVFPGSADLITPEFISTGASYPTLTFDWAYAAYSAAEIDELDIYYSTNAGASWTILLAMPGGPSGILNPFGLVTTSFFVPTASQWSTKTLALPAGTNMIKFTGISDYGNVLWLDNVKIGDTFFDNFENYTYPGQVACQGTPDWTTWTLTPCSNDDATLSTTYAYSGTKSALIDYVAPRDVDLVKIHDLNTTTPQVPPYSFTELTTGTWYIGFRFYIPAGKSGYFNIQGLFTGEQTLGEWGLQCYFNAGGGGELDTGGVVTFNWLQNNWNNCLVIVDLDAGTGEFWVGSNAMAQIATWDWTRGGTQGSTLDGVDFYGAVANGDQMYIDDFRFSNVPPPIPLPANEVGTTSIDMDYQYAPGTVVPKATVKNNGTNTNTFNVQMTITPGGYTSTIAVTDLAPGATQQVTFGNWNQTTVATYQVDVCTQLTGDEDPLNNCQSHTVSIWDDSGVWTSGASLPGTPPHTAYNGSGVSYNDGTNDWLFVMGGNTPNPPNDHLGCYKYNVTTDTWTQIANLPSGRLIHDAAVVGDYIYVFGGSDGTNYSNTIYKYNIAANTWSLLPTVVPTTIGWCRAVSYLDRYIYLAGGYDGVANSLNTVYLFDANTETISAASPMPLNVFGGGFGITGTTLVYAGGAYDAGISNTVMVGQINGGNPALISWAVMENTMPGIGKEVRGKSGENFFADTFSPAPIATGNNGHLPLSAVFPAGAIYRTHAHTWGNDAIIMGGGTPTSSYPQAGPSPCYVYKPSTDTWTAQENVPVTVGAHQSGTFSNGSTWKYVIASGFGTTVAVSNTQIYTQTLGATTFALSVPVTLGWNMVSAPGLHPVDQNVGTWWPHRTGTVWGFNGVQYVSRTVTTQGEGYWMKNTLAETYNYPAITIVPHNPVPATLGWNMMGGYETSPTIVALKAANPQITGTVWGFNGVQYVAATNLVPGYGYWVKTTAAGNITIPDAIAKGNEVVELFKEDWGRIILTDAAGLSYTLYSVKGEVDLSQYEMPPMPPSGSFDIRYSSGRIAEDLNSAIKTIDMSGVTYPLTVRVEGMDIRLMDETGKTVNVNLKDGEDVVINDATINKLMVSGEMIPAEYALEQNYPNPFNPSTMIEFSLPENVGNVKLSIYNALGEKVAELVNTALTAGKYQYQWNAQNVATGMYIYELRTDKFVSVKKMLLLK